MNTLLTLRQGMFDDAAVVYADGEIDLATAPQLADALRTAVGKADRLVVADLTAVRFLGSAGMAVLVSVSSACSDRGQAFVVVAASDGPARRSLVLTGLDRVLRVADDLQAALGASLPKLP